MSESNIRIVNGVKIGKVANFKSTSVDNRYPFELLEVGECFWFSEKDVSINTMRCRAYQRGASLGKKFSVNRKTKQVVRVK